MEDTDVIASNEADGKKESNQLEVPLISNGSMLLERSKSKSDGNIGEESKFGLSNEGQFSGMKSRSVAGSIDSEARQGDAVNRRKKKLTEKMRGFQLDELERKRSNLHSQLPLSGKWKDVIQTLVNKKRFILGITETRLGCHLMQIKSHAIKDCIQGVIETLGIQTKMTS